MNRIRSLFELLGHFLTHTLGVRFLFALAISIILWVLFTAERNPVREDVFGAEIPVETSRLGDGLVLSRTTPSTVRLRIAAPRDLWDTLTADNFRVAADLYAVGAGIHEVAIRVESPESIRVIAAEPATVTVALEQRKEKEVPVQVELVGAPPFGYRFQLEELLLLPDVVKVIGPESKVDLVAAVWLRVEVHNARSTVSLTQRAVPRDAQGENVTGVQLDPPVVQVSVPVEQLIAYKDVPVRVNVVGEPGPGYYVSLYRAEPATARLYGAPEQLDEWSFVSTVPIDVTGATGTITQTAGLARPSGIVGISSENEVEVTVEVLPVMGSAETQIVVVHENLPPGLDVSINPAIVALTLYGPAPELRELDASSIIVSVNLTGLGAGTYTLSPIISAPDALTVEGFTPRQLQVVLTARPTPQPSPAPAAPTPTPTPAAESPPPTPTPGT